MNDKNTIGIFPVYEIHIKNSPDQRWLDWFEGMTITNLENGEAILTGPIIDQSALHGLLNKIRDLNLTLISVRKYDVGTKGL
jgi:hypothetical protein